MPKKKKPARLGATIREARKDAGLSQAELAEKADVPRGQPGVYRIERLDMHVRSWRVIERIRRVLGM